MFELLFYLDLNFFLLLEWKNPSYCSSSGVNSLWMC